jgi:hypothetical protein
VLILGVNLMPAFGSPTFTLAFFAGRLLLT